MPIYNYKGIDANTGANRKGKVEAETPKAARLRLKQRDKIIASELKEEASLEKVKTKTTFSTRGVKLADIAVMTRQFATLQTAHIPLDESLRALTAQVENLVLRNTLSAVKDKVSEGKSLAEASAAFPGVFGKLYVNMVRAGESSGTLGLVLERLADYMEGQVEARGQFVSAMSYPLVMIVANICIVMYLFISLVPKLTKVFDSLKVTLPWYTRLVIGISEWMQANWFLMPIIVGVFYFLFKHWVTSEKGRYKFDELMLKAPVFGPLILRMQVSRFTQTLSTLLGAGVPIIAALDITKNILTNVVLSKVIEGAKVTVQEGKNLGSVLEKSEKFPPLVTHMIMTGERTGQLEDMLGHVAVAYEAEVKRKIESMIAIVEPVMIILMVVVVGGVVGALIVPMLSITSQIR